MTNLRSLAVLPFLLVCDAVPAAAQAGEIYKQAAPSVVGIDAKDDAGVVRWTGTGFVVAADGRILTNYHVIRNSKTATVRLPNGDAYDSVEVMDVDRRKDIALLKIKAVELVPLHMGRSSQCQVGDTVYSLSNALGLDNTLSSGLVSGMRQMDGYRLLQVTTPISHGSSGGPLFNTKGEVVGITTLALEGGQSLNFAVPIDYAKGILTTPSLPSPLSSVYDPEKETPPAVTSPPESEKKTVDTMSPSASIPDEMRQAGLGTYLAKRLQSWTAQDAQAVMGEPGVHRNGYDDFKNIISDIYTYRDPTLQVPRLELAFSTTTKRMTDIYLYPVGVTLDEAKTTMGERPSARRLTDSLKVYNFKTHRANVIVDKTNRVVSIGLY